MRTQNTLTVFSGDALGPSLEGSILKGGHIMPILNHFKVNIACYGNHDFDFGEDRLVELSSECEFPWVLSNAYHGQNGGELLASAKEYII
ncbi:Metallo-dependent phosphatase [Marasmius fiardii PR-910]|nr:Metallo-dependent phosphatase [Marasmius fiardii PR-910]